MTSGPTAIGADQPLSAAVDRMKREGMRHLPVLENDKVVGVLSQRDLFEATGWRPDRFLESDSGLPKLVRDYMHVPPETIGPKNEVAEACRRIVQRKVGCLPVVDGGALVGIVTSMDLLGAYARSCREIEPMVGEDPPLGRRMSTDLVVADNETTIEEAIALCGRKRIRHLPVVYDGWFVGLVSDRDLRLSIGRGDRADTPIEKIMVKYTFELGPESRMSEAAHQMIEHGIGSVAVVEEERLVGMLTSTDVMAHCATFAWDRGSARTAS